MQPQEIVPLILAMLLALGSGSAIAEEVRVYVTDNGGDRVEAIDPATNKVVQVLAHIPVPHGIGFSPDSRLVYVSSETKRRLYILDRETGKLLGAVRLSGQPNNIAVTKDGARVLVAIRQGKGALDVVDSAKRSLITSIPANGSLHNVYITPDSKYAVTGSIEGQTLAVIDLATYRPIWEIEFDAGVRPMAIEPGPDGGTKRIFVELSGLHGFVIVDFAAHKEIGRITLPELALGSKIEGADQEPCHGIAVAPDGKSLWVNSIVDNAVFAYSLPDLRLLGHVSLPVQGQPGDVRSGAWPYWVAITPDNLRAFISNSAINSVSVIDMVEMKLVAVVPVGDTPKRSSSLVLRN